MIIKKYKIQLFLIAIAALIGMRFWSFQSVADNVYEYLEMAVTLSLLVIVLLNYKILLQKESVFKSNVILFIFIPLVSCAGALLFHSQSVLLSLLVQKINLFWLLYFVLHIYNIPARSVVNLMIFIGLVWVAITVVQQFTYPDYYFYSRSEAEGKNILRAGIYRFMVWGHHYGLFVTFYFFYKYLNTKKLYNLVLVLAGLTGFYYFGTRQFIFGVIACIVIAALRQKGIVKLYSILLIVAVSILLIYFENALFGGYIKLTNDQLASNDEIRYLSLNYWLFEYWPHWLAVFLGNGLENFKSAYGQEILKLMENNGLYRTDVGIIGTFNTYGIFYAINIILVNIKGCKNIFYTKNTEYLKLFFWFNLMVLVLNVPYASRQAIPFFCFIFYLIDKAYEDKKIESAQEQADIDSYSPQALPVSA